MTTNGLQRDGGGSSCFRPYTAQPDQRNSGGQDCSSQVSPFGARLTASARHRDVR